MYPSSRQQLRQSLRQQRCNLTPQQQAQHAKAIRNHFCLHRNLQQAKHIGIYLAQAGEADLSRLIRYLWRKQRHCYLPCLHSIKPRQLLFVAYTPQTPLVANRLGILEPRNKRPISLKQLDIILMPLVAFDAYGNRLGMGGGFYDYTLAAYKHRFNRQAPKLIGVAHSFQQVSHLTAQRWDVGLNAILTEQRIITRNSHGY